MDLNAEPIVNETYHKLSCDLIPAINNLEAGVLMCYLLNQREIFRKQNTLINSKQYLKNGFPKTGKEIEETLVMSRFIRESAARYLQNLDLLETTIQGTPPKTYYWINDEALIKLILEYRNNKCKSHSEGSEYVK